MKLWIIPNGSKWLRKRWKHYKRMILGCLYHYPRERKLRDVDRSIKRYKVRLVKEGYTKTYGIDYHETFSYIAKLNTIRVLISFIVNLDSSLH